MWQLYLTDIKKSSILASLVVSDTTSLSRKRLLGLVMTNNNLWHLSLDNADITIYNTCLCCAISQVFHFLNGLVERRTIAMFLSDCCLQTNYCIHDAYSLLRE